MSAQTQTLRDALEDVLGVRRPHESVKAMLRRLASELGYSPRKARKLWYGEQEYLSWDDAERIRMKARTQRETGARYRDMMAMIEIQELKARIGRLENGERKVDRRASDPRPSEEDGQRSFDLGGAARCVDREE